MVLNPPETAFGVNVLQVIINIPLPPPLTTETLKIEWSKSNSVSWCLTTLKSYDFIYLKWFLLSIFSSLNGKKMCPHRFPWTVKFLLHRDNIKPGKVSFCRFHVIPSIPHFPDRLYFSALWTCGYIICPCLYLVWLEQGIRGENTGLGRL